MMTDSARTWSGIALQPGYGSAAAEAAGRVKAERGPAAVRARLAGLARTAEGTGHLMAPLIGCASAYCTVGEMVGALKAVWGEFQQPVVF